MSKFLVSSLLLLLALPAPSFAQETAPTVRVAHRDLNLSSPQGIAQLDRRLGNAVDLACSAWITDTLKHRADFAACRKAKLAEVAAQREQVIARSGAATQVAVAR